MQKFKNIICSLILISIVFNINGCGNTNQLISGAHRDSGNFMNLGSVAKQDSFLYINGLLTTCINLDNDEVTLNCFVPGCSHNSYACTAYEEGYGRFQKIDNNIYTVSSDGTIFKLGIGEREKVAQGKEAQAISLLFDNKQAYFVITQDPVTEVITGKLHVIDLSSGKEIIQFDNCTYSFNGFFYSNQALYFINQEMELCKASLDDGSVTVLEQNQVSRAMEYKDKIYYVQTNEETWLNTLMCMEMDGKNKKALAQNAGDFNIKEDLIYYSTWPGGELSVYDLINDSSKIMIAFEELNDAVSNIYLFEDDERIFFSSTFSDRLYSVLPNGKDLKKYHIPQYTIYYD